MAGAQALVAFFGLTAIHVSAAILYKYSQSGGKYEYSPATTLVLAEVFKILLSLVLHCVNTWEGDNRLSWWRRAVSSVRKSLSDAWRQVNARIAGQLCSLALSYAIYNQCQFLVFMWADAASVILLRSSGSFVAAVMAYFLLQRVIVRLQWLNIGLQVFGLVLVQFDACRAQTVLSPVLYFILFLHVSLSSFNSIWNEHLVKRPDAPSLNVQNAVLYCFGAFFNLAAYMWLPPSIYGSTEKSTGFFHGYSTITILIVALNSVIGLAITAVYKYADVIVKTFSLACATGTLFLLDYLLFARPITLNVILGIIVVYGASYLYFASAPKPTLPAPSTASKRPNNGSTPHGPSNTAPMNSEAQGPKPHWALLFVPEFLVVKAPPKTTLFAFLLTFLLVSGYVATHTDQLKSAQAKLQKPLEPIAPIVMIAETETTSPVIVKKRDMVSNSSLDQFDSLMQKQRNHRKNPNIELAICFYGAETEETKRTIARWNAELDSCSDSSFDKFVVVDSKSGLDYANLVDPVAYFKSPVLDYEYAKGIKTTFLEQDLNEWSRLTQSISACAELMEYHSEREGFNYKWAWIADASVVWNNTLAKRIRSTPQPPFPDLSSLDPTTGSIAMRFIPNDIVRAANAFKTVEPVAPLPDPSSVLGSFHNVIDFAKKLRENTDQLTLQYMTDFQTKENSGYRGGLERQHYILNGEVDVAALIKTSTEALYLSILQSGFIPIRRALLTN